ncbi:cornifelin homolog B isoform X1 [Neoarius graeffei]|uniref:cornifelin homolog B isoform X1 n=1 Tax=Neoarius graeffei TaxID=443677 RepID=UPI00298C4209|nr:cornifelin homolog B isoform X1 [Neoarius graeffei]XP_060792520.1 cornifelin homolog B isoform X1 [Neoarius graeffei]
MQQLHLLKSEGQILSDGFGQRSEELHGTQAERWTSWSDGAELPVLTQPGLGVTTTTVTTITQTGGDWSTGLFDVCDDVGTCLVGVCMPCCLEVSLAHQYGECLCLPLLPASTFAMRVAIRERFKIRGSVCEDWVTVYCCYPLAVCQMMREMKRRLKRQMYTVTTTLESS